MALGCLFAVIRTVSLPKKSKSSAPVALFQNKDFKDHLVKTRSLEWTLSQYYCIVRKRDNLGTDTDKGIKKGAVRT